jgi:hypothetical protein
MERFVDTAVVVTSAILHIHSEQIQPESEQHNNNNKQKLNHNTEYPDNHIDNIPGLDKKPKESE